MKYDASVTEHPVVEFVQATLRAREVAFEPEEGSLLRLPHGSAEVVLEFDDLGGGLVIRVSAVVLDELDLEDDREVAALRAVNDRNRTLRFGKFTCEREGGRIRLEYDLLGNWLQAEELMNAVASVAQIADDHDDLLRDELGSGRRAADR